jgi:LysR family glycine cleavage system transcriptional activator
MYQDDWPAWLEAAVQEPVEFAGEAVFHLQLTSLAAAVDGVGLAIGRTPLVDADLASGKLVQPFDVRVPSSSAYFITSPHDKAKSKKVELFRDWALGRLSDHPRDDASAAPREEPLAAAVDRRMPLCLSAAIR